MLYELERIQYGRVRSLFEPLRFHLASAAVLEGNSPGRVFADDSVHPRAAFMLSPEGAYLVGDPSQQAFSRSLRDAVVRHRVLGDEVRVLLLIVGEGWKPCLQDVVEPCALIEKRRFHYVCSHLSYDWRDNLPDGCTICRIDRALLGDRGLSVPGHVDGWIGNNWGSTESFFGNGFGYVTICEREIVSWSLTDCVSGAQCEIGIRTAIAHRRRGLAAATAAAAAEHALSDHYVMVGWHCPCDNLGSIRTAEKIGFRRERAYTAHHIWLDDDVACSG